MATPGPYVPNGPLALSKNLRFIDDNGILVTQLYPVNPLGAVYDTPTTGYISRIGAVLSDQIDLYDQVTTILTSYNTRISALETDVENIQASGATTIPTINARCLSTPANQTQPITTVLNTFLPIWCQYVSVTGDSSGLSGAILAEGATTLNALPAYSQVSAMSGLAGWKSSPATIADSITNLWLAYLDMRSGVTRALNQSNVTCSSIVITPSGTYTPSERSITIYFPGSYIPTNFSENGSHLLVEDGLGNSYTANFNALTAVNTDGNLVIDISASTLSEITDYTVTLTYNVTSTTPALTCTRSIVVEVNNSTAVCPNLSTTVYAGAGSTASILFSFTPTVTENVVYTVDLLNTSGSTSGTTIHTKTYTNPAVPIVDSFTGLNNSTSYGIRVTVTIKGEANVCTTIIIMTPS